VKAGMNRQLSNRGGLFNAQSRGSESLSTSRPKSTRHSSEVDIRRPLSSGRESIGFQLRPSRMIKQNSLHGGSVRPKSFTASRQGWRKGRGTTPSRYASSEMLRPKSSQSFLRSKSLVLKHVDLESQIARQRLKRKLKAKQERFEQSRKLMIKNRKQQLKVKRAKEETRMRIMKSRNTSTESIPMPNVDRPLKRIRKEKQKGWLKKKNIWSDSVEQNKRRLQKVQREKQRCMDIKWKQRREKNYSRLPKKTAKKYMVSWPSSTQALKSKPTLTFFQRVTNTFEFNWLIPALVEGRRKKWHPGVLKALEKNLGIKKITRKTSKAAFSSIANRIEDAELSD